jgi:hypothetical protein
MALTTDSLILMFSFQEFPGLLQESCKQYEGDTSEENGETRGCK